MRRYALAWFLFLPLVVCAQQTDTSYALPFIEVTANSVLNKNLNTQTWMPVTDNIPRGMSLDQLLQQRGLASIRSYGAGNLATISLRGATSAQTSMIWNGVPINNAMLGLADLSNVPVDGFDELSIDYGSDAIKYGSASIGGNIRLNSGLEYKKEHSFSAQLSQGSFGNRQGHFGVSFGDKKWSSATRMGSSMIRNDFVIPVLNSKQQSSAVRRSYLIHSSGWRPQENMEFKIDFWRQQSNRQVPPTTRQNSSNAYQIDANNRIALSMNKIAGAWKLKGTLAWMKDQLDYYDPQIRLTSPSSINTQFAKAEAKKISGNWTWNFGFEARKHRAQAFGYSENSVQQNYKALFSEISFGVGNWRWIASARKAHFNNSWIPLIPRLKAVYKREKHMLYASFSGHYRIPSLNELYWRPGGNRDLIPEQGWSAEMGGETVLLAKGKWHSAFKVSGFYRQLDNWLQWTLPEGENLFQARNIDEIIGWGLESNWKGRYVGEKCTVELNVSYTKVRSFSRQELAIPKRASGQQLHYIPEHRGIAVFDLSLHNWRLAYTHQYQGIMDGFNKRIHDYHLGNLLLTYRMNLHSGNQCALQLECRNAFNQSYEVVEFRPMPGRNYMISIIYSLKK